MEIREMITKFGMTLAEKDGQEGIRAYRKPTTKQVEEIKAKKPEIIAELHRIEDEKKAEEATEKARLEAEKEGLINGTIKITVDYYDGEYLSGYAVHGQAAELLIKIGVAEAVSGWGYHIGHKAIEVLGEEFTYLDALEYTRPAREAKAAKEAEAKAARQAIFDTAKETGEKQVLRSYATDCNDPKEECSTDIITVYAMPDGSTKTDRTHTW